MGTIQINMRLDRELIDKFEEMGKKDDRDRTYYMRKALEQYVGGEKKAVAIKSVPCVVVEKEQLCDVDVKNIFHFWLRTMSKTNSVKLTSKRFNSIKARLREGYTSQQIADAINGCAVSEFHMGQNDAGKAHNDITLICRSGDKLEQFIEYLTPVKRESTSTRDIPIEKQLTDRSWAS